MWGIPVYFCAGLPFMWALTAAENGYQRLFVREAGWRV